jgi:proline utilization trans-activator
LLFAEALRELFELKTRVKQLERNLQLCRGTLPPAQSLVGQQHAFDISAVDTEHGDTMGPDHMQAAESAAAVGSSSLGAPSSVATSTENSSGNPLVPDRPSYITENSGRIRWLGHSSTYAFTQKVFQIVQREGPSNPTPEMQMSNDGRIYTAETDLLVPMKTPDVSNLPSKATAMHYLEVIKFRTKPLFYLFDDTSFTAGLDQFYRDPVMFAGSDMIWFAHFLVLMALGKSLDPHSIYKSGSDGQVSVYFTRALQMLPDMTYLCGQNMTSTELLCSIAIYLQSVDHRQAAMLYVSIRRSHPQYHYLY